MGVSACHDLFVLHTHCRLCVLFIASITSAEPEAKESWRSVDEKQQAEFQAGPCSKWAFGAGELIKSAEKITKVRNHMSFHTTKIPTHLLSMDCTIVSSSKHGTKVVLFFLEMQRIQPHL